MNFDGFNPHEFTRFSSLVEQDDATALPAGVGVKAQNVQFRGTGVKTRDGIQLQMLTPTKDQPITGLASLINNQTTGQTQVPFIFDFGGRAFIESPVGSGELKPVIDPNNLVSLPASAHAIIAPAYNRAYLAFTDLKTGKATPSVYDLPTGNLDPYTMRPFGDRWQANTAYKVGEVITPNTGTTGDGHTYRCTTAGTSGSGTPTFNSSTGATTADGTVVWTENTALMTTSGATGNICTGQRYMVVLFKNRNGYITGMTEASVQGLNVVTGSRQLVVGSIPIGPANTAARILCFTVAGGSTVGDYFYIPSNDSVSGISMTSTVINDNVTTGISLNFTDQYLLASTKVTSFFRKIQAPSTAIDIYYAPSIDRMILTQPTGHLVSLVADPESIYGDTGVVVAGNSDSQTHMSWREFKSNQYSLKSASGYLVAVDPNDPSKWQVSKQWDKVGPCGPRAVDVGKAFMCFVHRTGVYVYFGTGDPQFITKELPKTWRRINWDNKHLIWVNIDEETKEIRIGVPLDTSNVPNAILKCNYEESPDFAPPIHFSAFTGKFIASGESRKWSIDDIPAYLGMRVERNIPSNTSAGGNENLSGQDALTRQSQMLFASSQPDGAVNAVAPGVFNDNEQGIDSQYECASVEELMKVNQLGGIAVNADGSGDLQISIIFGRELAADKSNKTDLKAVSLTEAKVKPPKSVGGRGQNERMRPRFSNGKQPNAWFELRYAALYARPIAQSR